MIELADFKTEYKLLSSELEPAIKKVMASGNFILGQEVGDFEKNFSEYCGCRYALATSSGTDAIKLSLLATGIGPNDEVITVSNSFIATSYAIHEIGAKPVWVDIDKYSYNLDPDKIEAAISSKTKAILPVHLFGHPAEIDLISEIAKRYNLKVIEDSCQAHGALYREARVGSLADAAAFSFYPSKNLGCYGDGGVVTTNDLKIYERLKKLRNYGQSRKNIHDIFGYNCRLDTLQAAILLVKLKYLDQWNQRRRELASIYNHLLTSNQSISIPQVGRLASHVYHQYVVRVPEESREPLMVYLREHGISSAVHYPVPIHKQKPFVNSSKIALHVTETMANQILSLPIHQYLQNSDVEYVADKINNFFKVK